MRNKNSERVWRWRLNNPEKYRAGLKRRHKRSSQRRPVNPEKYQAQKAKSIERVKRWRLNNPDKFKALQRRCAKRYRERNPQKIRDYAKAWRQKNPDKSREYRDRWRQKNPEAHARQTKALLTWRAKKKLGRKRRRRAKRQPLA